MLLWVCLPIKLYPPIKEFHMMKKKKVIENIKTVKKVIAQETLDYRTNILKYKPDFVVHGDDWKEGIQKN